MGGLMPPRSDYYSSKGPYHCGSEQALTAAAKPLSENISILKSPLPRKRDCLLPLNPIYSCSENMDIV